MSRHSKKLAVEAYEEAEKETERESREPQKKPAGMDKDLIKQWVEEGVSNCLKELMPAIVEQTLCQVFPIAINRAFDEVFKILDDRVISRVGDKLEVVDNEAKREAKEEKKEEEEGKEEEKKDEEEVEEKENEFRTTMAFMSFLGRLLFVSVFALSAFQEFNEFGADGRPAAKNLRQNFNVFDMKHLILAAIAMKAVGSLLFVFGSSLGASILLLYQAISAPVLYDFYNYDADKEEFVQLFVKFIQSLALLGGLLFFIGMKNSMARRLLKKKATKAKAN
ncbi:HR-like lesion-inducing protein-related [Striga asiatica]|uniref:HR-like lesion-inducing protein-related n=1 Tax=Striga asiatica TaxID=4170 RepID=A0A5A7RG36_STRAF|nr:HR-like lesion-inducing protein-related [Striga asiatica]